MFLPGKGNRTEILSCFSIPSFTWTHFKYVLLCVCDLNLTGSYFQMERFEVPVPGLCAAQLLLQPPPWAGGHFPSKLLPALDTGGQCRSVFSKIPLHLVVRTSINGKVAFQSRGKITSSAV